MIALRALVVVSDDSLSRVAVEEPVLVVMSASFYRGRNAPDHHLQNRAVVEVHPVALKQFGLHVGNYANRLGVVNCEAWGCAAFTTAAADSRHLQRRVIEKNLVVAQMVIIPNRAPATNNPGLFRSDR
jgi:hypothetical protein